jgi:hypothetical protein
MAKLWAYTIGLIGPVVVTALALLLLLGYATGGRLSLVGSSNSQVSPPPTVPVSSPSPTRAQPAATAPVGAPQAVPDQAAPSEETSAPGGLPAAQPQPPALVNGGQPAPSAAQGGGARSASPSGAVSTGITGATGVTGVTGAPGAPGVSAESLLGRPLGRLLVSIGLMAPVLALSALGTWGRPARRYPRAPSVRRPTLSVIVRPNPCAHIRSTSVSGSKARSVADTAMTLSTGARLR